MEHPFDRLDSNDRDTPCAMCCCGRMPPETPLRGRCLTPTAPHTISARNRPARAAELPIEPTTEPDELLPARAETRRPADHPSLLDTRLDGLRYRAFVQKLSEEVVLQDWDSRVERPAYPAQTVSGVRRRTVPMGTAADALPALAVSSDTERVLCNEPRRSG